MRESERAGAARFALDSSLGAGAGRSMSPCGQGRATLALAEAVKHAIQTLHAGLPPGVVNETGLEAVVGQLPRLLRRQPERGKGLPKIHKWSTEKRIRSLVIVSNFVYANVEAEHYRLMSHSFEGTLLYWEVEP